MANPDLVALRDRLLEIRRRLAEACAASADVEDQLAATLSQMTTTASAERRQRLLGQAQAARDYSATQRARARRYSGDEAQMDVVTPETG